MLICMALNPVIFNDGSDFFVDLATKYKKHKNGLFILAPSGAGKTHYIKSQTENDWIDGDYLWEDSNAHPDFKEKWWTQGIEVINRVDQRSDVITLEATDQGFWIMGASNYWLKPDAIVIPDWDVHVNYIKHREENNYDGGATSDALGQVKEHIETMLKWHNDHDVPVYKSIAEAVENLTNAL